MNIQVKIFYRILLAFGKATEGLVQQAVRRQAGESEILEVFRPRYRKSKRTSKDVDEL